ASGRSYAWEVSHHPDDTPLAPLPQWLLPLLTTNQGARQRPQTAPGAPIGEGQRNDTLFHLAASLRQRGLSDDAIVAAIDEENRTRCHPPLRDDEVEALVQSALRYTAGSYAPKDWVDAWLGPRSQWCGIPLDVRRIP